MKPIEFYANGLYWKIYNDGKNVVYVSSVDELNWSPPTAMCVAPIREHPDEKVLWFREGQFNAEEILSGEACKVSLRDPPGSVKPLLLWSRSADFPRIAGFMIGDASHFRRILAVTKEGDNVIYEVGPYQDEVN